MKTLVNKIISTTTGLDTVPVRIGAGIIFAAHGAQKLFGWFGGYGLEGTAGWMDSIGLGPGLLMATLAGSAEFFGGLLLIIGLLVRPAALVLAATMVVAIVTVHLGNGLFMAGNTQVTLSGDFFAGVFSGVANTMTGNDGNGFRCVGGGSIVVRAVQNFGALGTNGGGDSFRTGSCPLFDSADDPIIN